MELKKRKTGDIVGVGESQWEEVIGREALQLRGVRREALWVATD